MQLSRIDLDIRARPGRAIEQHQATVRTFDLFSQDRLRLLPHIGGQLLYASVVVRLVHVDVAY